MNAMEREQAAPGDEGGAGQNPVRWSRTSVAASASASLGLADSLHPFHAIDESWTH